MEGAKKPDPDQDDRTINLGGAAHGDATEGDEKHPNPILKYRIRDPWDGEPQAGGDPGGHECGWMKREL